jgi:hypothetical protein
MSKLVEKLERTSEGRGQPLGFGAAANRVKTLPVVLIAVLTEGDAKATAAAAAADVDAVLITGVDPEKADGIAAHLKSEIPDVPWGLSLESVTRDNMQRLAEMGCDFVIFPPAGGQAAALNVETIGKVLKIDASLDDTLARSISRLPVDAVFLGEVGGGEGALTVEQLMVYDRLVGASGKHLVAALPPDLPLADVESLWGLGVQAVAADLAVSDPKERLSEVRESLEKLPTKRRRPGSRFAASLPISGEGSGGEPPDEEDEEY